MTQPADERTRLLFICMGNICRSPLAEGLFRHKAAARGAADRFEVDSAGIGSWHVGELADPRARSVAAQHGVELASRARQIDPADFARFDLLLCADNENRDLLLRSGAPADKTRLLLEFDRDAPVSEVPDPYLGGMEDFELVYRLLDSACDALLDRLLAGDAEP